METRQGLYVNTITPSFSLKIVIWNRITTLVKEPEGI